MVEGNLGAAIAPGCGPADARVASGSSGCAFEMVLGILFVILIAN